ncbi:MAG: hypothetical protein ACKOHH_10470 [Bacteroidota bacterium]
MLPPGSTIIGRIEKAHCLHVILLAHLDPQIQISRLPRNPSQCWVELGGRWTPFRCLEFRHRIPRGILIKLDNILNPEQGRPLFQAAIALENVQKPLKANTATLEQGWGLVSPEALQGATLVDKATGSLGQIVRLHHRPPQDFLEFMVGSQAVYLPMVPEFVKKWHADRQELECQLPEGLLDLYLNPHSGEDPVSLPQEPHDED